MNRQLAFRSAASFDTLDVSDDDESGAPPSPRYRHRCRHRHRHRQHGEGIASSSVNWLYPPRQEEGHELLSPLYGSQSLGCWVSPLPSTGHCFGWQCLALCSANIITNGCNPCRLSWCRPSIKRAQNFLLSLLPERRAGD